MAKSKKNTPAIHQVNIKPEPATSPMAAEQSKERWTIGSFRLQALVLAVIAFLFYANTFVNEYALDDWPIIINNEYVQSGTAGIPKILSGDALESYYKNSNADGKLAGGRYRPLSIVTFAIEQQMLGLNEHSKAGALEERQAFKAKAVSDMHFRHVINVLLYIGSILLLLTFLRKIVFPGSPLAAFTAALLFTIHPVHTEVVANVKSRDEIMSLIFILLTLLKTWQYSNEKKMTLAVAAAVYFFLALLSKEYALMLLFIAPVVQYYRGGTTFAGGIKLMRILVAPLVVYLAIRFSSVTFAGAEAGADVLNNPYLYATAVQKIASIIGVLLNYILLLFVPYPLSADYSYNQLPYLDLGSVKTLVSLAVYVGLIATMAVMIKKRHIAGLGIAVFVAFIFPVSNLLINIGAPMGERFLFHASLGFVIIAGWALAALYEKLGQSTGKMVVSGVCGVLILLCGIETVARNADWKSDVSLFLTDVKKVPNSAPANCFAGGELLNISEGEKDTVKLRSNALQAIRYFDKAITIHPRYTDAYLNRGIAYLRIGNYDKAIADCDTVTLHFPQHPRLKYLAKKLADHYFDTAMAVYQRGDHAAAYPVFYKALEADPFDTDLWYNVGYACLLDGKLQEAKSAAERALSVDAGNAKAQQLLLVVKERMK